MRQLSRISLRDILYILFRDKYRILVVTLSALIGASVWLAFQNSIYVAESHVLVRVGKEKLSGIESYAKDNYNILFQERGQDIHNGIEIIKDNQLAYAVLSKLRPLMQPAPAPKGWFKLLKYQVKELFSTVKEWLVKPLYWLGLRTRLSEEEMLVRALQGSLAVEAIEDTDIIRVSFGWPDPQFAALAVNTFVDEFLTKYIKVSENALSETFYRDQFAKQQKKLTDAEAALSSFRAEHGITDLALQKSILLKEISEEESALNEVTIRYQEYLTLRDGVAEALHRGDDWIQTPEFRQRGTVDLTALDRQFFDLAAKRAQLSTTHTARSVEMQHILEQMGQLREQKAQNLISFFTMNMQTASQEKSFLEGRLRVKRDLLAGLDRQTSRLADLELQRGMAEQNYTTYRKKAEELRVSDQLNDLRISGARIVSEARAPSVSTSPRRGLVLGLAVLLGLFLGVGYSAVAEYFNHTFRDNEDVERILGAHLLMTVPSVGDSKL